jgi:hypothetical protein
MIDFEDVATPDSDGVVPITEERYAKDGIILRGTDGQFVGQRFGYPDSYRPHSGKNMFAPGPVAGTNGAVGEGGHETAILFSINGKPASVAGFGAHFIDCNGGENGLIAYDSSGKELAKKLDVYGSKAVAMFVGVLAVDSAGQPVPSISKLVLHNGSGWPGVYNNYGVVIDDLLYSVPQVIAVKK